MSPDTPSLPKYTRPEFERRFLVRPESVRHLRERPYWLVEDRYLHVGRLRLRRITESDSGRQTRKLGKKFEATAPDPVPIVNIYLSEEEYEGLLVLEGADLVKRRYHDDFRGHRFGIDIFDGELAGLVMCETEAETREALEALEFPPYAMVEVTGRPFFTGGRLCRVGSGELTRRIREVLRGVA